MKTSSNASPGHKLLQWYRENKRDLPWRENRDPYKIWISEIMLQQTTVSAVIPYFERFIKNFPNVEALAKAPENHVLGLWSGLGYYSRARNLHKAAKEILALGKFPKTSEELLKLSGIGPYTSAAIASIAFNEEVAAVDGNVIRVISRLFDISKDVSTKEGQVQIQKHATQYLKGQVPFEHNQAMMELGATICTPKNPMCLLCPISKSCKAYKAGTALQRPVKKKTKKEEIWLWEMLLSVKKGRLALAKSENGTPWLKGMWVLPGKASLWEKKNKPAYDFKHTITYHKIYIRLKEAHPSQLKNQDLSWVLASDIKKRGVSSVVQKALLTAQASEKLKNWEK